MSDAPAEHVKRPRDERLDLFRGITMLIIFVPHMPGNTWYNYIPARFGFSSGTELFVFCSGLASSIAFGSVFVKRGMWLGSVRIAHRIWQVYWAHIGLVVTIIATVAFLDNRFDLKLVSEQFAPLLSDPARAIMSLVTLTWLPDYLDILPMYIVILALVPVMMGLRRINPALPFLLAALLYTFVWTSNLNLPGNPWSGEGWFLNPFAWQLVFFTGFAFGMKWLPAPKFRETSMLITSAAILALAVPLSFNPLMDSSPLIKGIHEWIFSSTEKSNLHILRFIHFLALAYVVLSLVEPYKTRLDTGLGHLLIVIGRQSLGTFLTSIVLARIGAVVADALGHGGFVIALINLGAFTLLFVTAVALTWIKSTPWTRRASNTPVPQDHTTVTFAREGAVGPNAVSRRPLY